MDKDYIISTGEVTPYILASAAVIIIIVILLIQRLRSSQALEKQAAERLQANEQERAPVGPRRVVAGARNRRNARLRQQDQGIDVAPAPARAQRAAEPVHPPNEDGESDSGEDDPQAATGKIGAKKRKKLEMKAEKKAQRERDLQEREEEKKKKALQDEMQKIEEEKKQKEEDKQAEEERRFLEEKLRKEQEEYNKMKAMFSVEEEGYDKAADEEETNLLQEFIGYIKREKVVYLEDLAAHFKLRTQEVIDRIKELQESGDLSGVTDDRGKYIYISMDELKAVAKFISQRGRVSIAELAESSNSLISLKSEEVPVIAS